MRIAIDGPELSAVNFDEVLEIFKQELCFDLHFLIIRKNFAPSYHIYNYN